MTDAKPLAKPPPVRLRFLIAWGAYSKGAIIEPPAMVRQRLLATVWYGKRVVEIVQEPPAAVAPVVPPTTSVAVAEEPQPEPDRGPPRRKGRTTREES